MANVSSSNSQKALVPKLRFPGFEGEWHTVRLSDFTDRITRKNSQNESDLPLTISSKDGLVDQISYFNKTVASKDMSGYYLLLNGEFAYNKSYSVGFDFGSIKRLDRYPMGALSTLYICFSVKNYDSDFIKTYFDSLKWYKEIYMIAAEGARNHGLLNVPTEDFFATRHTLPTNLKEQKKIAAFMKLLERRIDAQRRLVEALKSYKRGALSKLFPKEGASVPEYRFAGFTGDWEQRKVSEVMETRRGLTFKPSDIRENGIRVLRSSNIDEDRFVLKNDDVFVDKNAVNVEYVKENDILITAANGSSRLVGKHAIICDIPVGSAVHGGFMLLGVAKEPYFINASMSSTWYKKFIDLFVAGGNGTIGNLNKNDLDNQYIPIPSKSERKKVGNFFRLLDNLIAFHRQEVSIAQKIKSGLLQGLFI